MYVCFRSRDKDDVRNPGNNLYVTGLSTRTQETDLEKFFSKEGKVKDCRVVIDPRTKESRGFAFVTMENVEDARRCIKYLHRTVLEGRLISVAKAKRTRERTPTPGEYCGPRGMHGDEFCFPRLHLK
uniref:RRM domain-containing protein n=1 Tax=Aegilops tauschii subsp. strangulata TaxID=200361 RepID=A0A453TEM3_AEGTS